MRFIFNFICKQYFHFLFKKKVAGLGNKSLVLIDIDNTLADTWPSLLDSSVNEITRLSNLSAFLKMKNLVRKLNSSPSRTVLFLTARSYKHFNVTFNWLLKNDLKVEKNQLVIVQNPDEKVDLIEFAKNKKVKVLLIDDMSFNHEKGEVKFYKKEIDRLATLKVKHIGYDSILKFNKKGS